MFKSKSIQIKTTKSQRLLHVFIIPYSKPNLCLGVLRVELVKKGSKNHKEWRTLEGWDLCKFLNPIYLVIILKRRKKINVLIYYFLQKHSLKILKNFSIFLL